MFERKINTYKNYFWDFMALLDEGTARKIYYSLDILKTQQRISKKFVEHIREGVYELKAEYEGNIYRVFFTTVWFSNQSIFCNARYYGV